MPFEPYQSERPSQNSPYQPVKPNEYTYTSGYGFSPRPPDLIERRQVKGYGAAVGLSLLVFFLSKSFVPVIAFRTILYFIPFPMYSAMEDVIFQLSTMAGAICSLLIPFFIFAFCIGVPLRTALPFRKTRPGVSATAVFVLLGVSVIGSFASNVLSHLLTALDIRAEAPGYAPPQSIVAFLLFFLNMTILPALFEEMMFRGLFLQSLRRFGDGFALLASAVLFSLAHANLLQFPAAFLAGLVIGYFVLFTGSLWTGVLMHFFNNLMVVLLITLSQRFPSGIQETIQNAVFLLYLALALVAMMTALRTYNSLFTLRPAATLNGDSTKLRAFFSAVPLVVAIVVIAMISLDL